MTSKEIVLLCIIVLSSYSSADNWYDDIHIRTIQALKPRGLRVFLPGDTRIKLFLFEATINNGTDNKFNYDAADVWGFGVKLKTRDGWIYENDNVTLEVGQTIVYRTFVSIGNPSIKTNHSNRGDALLQLAGYYSPLGIFTVKELEDPSAPGGHCPITATKVKGGYACAQEVIFEDNFDTFRDDLWQIEQYIPIDHPEHPFVTYQRPLTSDANSNIFIKNGYLHIVPKLQQDILKQSNQSILSGTLDLLSGCTGDTCVMQASGVNILPPIISGRLTSSRFAFTYGTIHVRAKLPRGDWIYPEIVLEPFSKTYGSLNYASGLLKVALSRGNIEMNSPRYTLKEVSGGPVMSAKCRDALEFYYKTISEGYWSDDFHEFSLTWTPEEIALYVDGVSFGTYLPGPAGLRAWLPRSCQNDRRLLAGTPMAPFDHHFQIALGVAVGGIMEFPDGLVAAGRPKPWLNRGRKASLSFWQDKDNWLPTWTQPGLIIDYVKVVAL